LVRPDVQAAVTVIGRRDTRRDGHRGINLVGAPLTDATLVGANLTGPTNLSSAILTRAIFVYAILTDMTSRT
jgi:uncharacterized protein YjbI with pentapeptide repeats